MTLIEEGKDLIIFKDFKGNYRCFPLADCKISPVVENINIKEGKVYSIKEVIVFN